MCIQTNKSLYSVYAYHMDLVKFTDLHQIDATRLYLKEHPARCSSKNMFLFKIDLVTNFQKLPQATSTSFSNNFYDSIRNLYFINIQSHVAKGTASSLDTL